MNDMPIIDARLFNEFAKRLPGWSLFQAIGHYWIDGHKIKRILHIEAKSGFDASKFCVAMVEETGAVRCTFKIKRKKYNNEK